MSAITYPASRHEGHAPRTPFSGPRLSQLIARRIRRWDDRLTVERNASLSEVTMRSVPKALNNYR